MKYLGFIPAAKYFSTHISVIFSFIAIAFLICTPVLNASEQNRTHIAVSDFAGKNVSAADASIFSDFLRAALVKTGKFSVIDKGNMDTILGEASFQQTGCTSSECAVKIGKILNVNKMVVGSLSKMEGIYYVTTSMVNVETGEIDESETAQCDRAERLMAAADEVADKYSGSRNAVPSRREEGPRAPARRNFGISIFSITPLVSIQALSLNSDELNGNVPGAAFRTDGTASNVPAEELGLGLKMNVSKNVFFDLYTYGNISNTITTKLSLPGQVLIGNTGINTYLTQANNMALDVNYSFLRVKQSSVFAGIGVFMSELSYNSSTPGGETGTNYNPAGSPQQSSFYIPLQSDDETVTVLNARLGYEWKYKDVFGISFTGSCPFFSPPAMSIAGTTGLYISGQWHYYQKTIELIKLQAVPVYQLSLTYYFGLGSIFN